MKLREVGTILLLTWLGLAYCAGENGLIERGIEAVKGVF